MTTTQIIHRAAQAMSREHPRSEPHYIVYCPVRGQYRTTEGWSAAKSDAKPFPLSILDRAEQDGSLTEYCGHFAEGKR